MVLQTYLNHPELSGRRYLPRGFPDDIPLSINQAAEIIEKWEEGKREVHLAIVQADGGELVGHADMAWDWDPLAPWVSVVIDPGSQRRGYGTEVMNLLLNHLFENTVANNVSSWMADWNQAARSFARSLGFQESGRSRREVGYAGLRPERRS